MRDSDPALLRPADGQVSFSARLATSRQDGRLQLDSSLQRSQRVTTATGLLHLANPVLRDCLASRGALVVLSPSVDRIYGRRIRQYFAAVPDGPPAEFMVLDRSESSKSLAGVTEVCDRAAQAGLRRTAPIVAIGGGVCCDICGLAASLHRRGVPHIKIPTTLVGLVDAGIGTKNAVNHGRRKSAIGSFHPPEHSLLDTSFLASLPRRHLLNGVAEIVKMAIIGDEALFRLLAGDPVALIKSGFRARAPAAEQIVRLSVTGMLTELARNPFEKSDFRRKVDFGHTFSPHFEVASAYSILHGEAVAMDIALSAEIARAIGLLGAEDHARILSLLQDLGLELTWPGVSVAALWDSLAGIIDHRDGSLHLVVPTAIGACEFVPIEAISPQLLRACTDRLARRPGQARLRPLPDGVTV